MDLLNKAALIYAYSVLSPADTLQALKSTDGPDCILYLTDRRLIVAFEFVDAGIPDGVYAMPSQAVAAEHNYELGFREDLTGLPVIVDRNGVDLPVSANPNPVEFNKFIEKLYKNGRRSVLARFRWPQNEAVDLRSDNAVDIVCTKSILAMRTIKNPSGEVESSWVVPAAGRCGQDFGLLTMTARYLTPLFSEPNCEVTVKSTPIETEPDRHIVTMTSQNYTAIMSTACLPSRQASCLRVGSEEMNEIMKEIQEMGAPPNPVKPQPVAKPTPPRPAPQLQKVPPPPVMPAAKVDPAIPKPPAAKTAPPKPAAQHKAPAVQPPPAADEGQASVLAESSETATQDVSGLVVQAEADANPPADPAGTQGGDTGAESPAPPIVETAGQPPAPPVILDPAGILLTLDNLIATAKTIVVEANAMKKGVKAVMTDRSAKASDKLLADIEKLKAELAKEKELGKTNAASAKAFAAMQKAMASVNPAAPQS